MTSVSRTFAVTPAPDAVLEYLKDFGHAEEWDPGTEKCIRVGSGPVSIGTTWQNTSRVVGVTTELTYTLKELSSDTIVFVGENDSATSTDTITVRPSTGADGPPGGSEITYRADLEMHGAAKLATPAMKLVFEKLANDTEKQMTDVLNKLPGR